MTTKAQLADALKPLLDRHDDLVLKDRFVLIKPLGYLWRSVMIDTSVDPDAFVPQVAIGLLISSSGYYSLRWGKRLYMSDDIPCRGKTGNLYLNEPSSTEQMLDMIESSILPELRSITSTRELLSHLATGRFTGGSTIWPEELEIVCLLIAGEFDAARALMETNETMLGYVKWKDPDLYPALLSHDHNRVASILRQWEAMALRPLRLEQIWEPIPLAFELMDGRDSLAGRP